MHVHVGAIMRMPCDHNGTFQVRFVLRLPQIRSLMLRDAKHVPKYLAWAGPVQFHDVAGCEIFKR